VIFNDANAGWGIAGHGSQTAGYADADPTRIGPNVCLEFHNYTIGNIGDGGTGNPIVDGRWHDGSLYPITSGGFAVRMQDPNYPTYPPGTQTRASAKQMLYGYFAPYKDCSILHNVPLIFGEFGWPTQNTTGGTDYVADVLEVTRDAGIALQGWWDYDVNPGSNVWSARQSASGLWRAEAGAWLTG
jgi:hypothetical protein